VAPRHLDLVQRLADAGVATMAHLGLRPQSVGLLGGYKVQGKSTPAAEQIIEQASTFAHAGAVAILLEAVPPEVSEQVVKAVDVPVIGCGAGPACHAHVFVTHDGLKLTAKPPRFAPELGDLATGIKNACLKYMQLINEGKYPGPEHLYHK
jgi:3-methyl-2-oxobutanoate hydroxymethyltransferase